MGEGGSGDSGEQIRHAGQQGIQLVQHDAAQSKKQRNTRIYFPHDIRTRHIKTCSAKTRLFPSHICVHSFGLYEYFFMCASVCLCVCVCVSVCICVCVCAYLWLCVSVVVCLILIQVCVSACRLHGLG